LSKKIILNFVTTSFLVTIIAIVISIISFFNFYNLLQVDGQPSSLPTDFDISECDQIINATSLRGMVHGSITNDCLNGGKGHDVL
jgi:hypothetical protein